MDVIGLAPVEGRLLDPLIAHHFKRAANGGSKTGIISSTRVEGVTTITANLGIALAERYRRRVVLVDSNLAHPRLHKIFGVPAQPGLLNLVQDEVELGDCLRPMGNSGLFILPAGRTPLDPVGALDDLRLSVIIKQLSQRFEITLFDCPPVERLADAASLVEQLDDLIFVVTSERTRASVARRSLGELELAGGKPIGVVMNRTQRHIPALIERLL